MKKLISKILLASLFATSVVFQFGMNPKEAYAAAAELYSTPLFSDANLVSYWRLSDGNDAKNVNNLTGTNVSYVAGQFGNALSLAGNGYLYKGAASNLPTTTMSIVGWFKVNDTTNPRFLFSFGRDLGATGGLALVAYGFSTINNYKPFFELGSGYGRVLSNTTLSTGTWYHVAVTADGTNTKFYMNGSLENTASQTTGTIASSPGISIGSYLDGATPPNPSAYYHNGLLDDVAIYNRVLDATEISNLYNGTWPSGATPAFLLYD